jgi:hypothetical protein
MASSAADALAALERWLREHAQEDVLMPVLPGTKRPMFRHKEGAWTWRRLEEWRASTARLRIGDSVPKSHLSPWCVVLRRLCVVDVDTPALVAEMEARFPALLRAPCTETARGRHYWFLRSPLADRLGYWDGAGQVRRGVDFKTVCRTGTGGIVLVPPSPGKAFLRHPADCTLAPVPDDLLAAVARRRSVEEEEDRLEEDDMSLIPVVSGVSPRTLRFQEGGSLALRELPPRHARLIRGWSYFEPFFGGGELASASTVPVPAPLSTFRDLLSPRLRSPPTPAHLARLAAAADLLGVPEAHQRRMALALASLADVWDLSPAFWAAEREEAIAREADPEQPEGQECVLVPVDAGLAGRLRMDPPARTLTDGRWLLPSRSPWVLPPVGSGGPAFSFALRAKREEKAFSFALRAKREEKAFSFALRAKREEKACRDEASGLGTPSPRASGLGTPSPRASGLGTPSPRASGLGTPSPRAPPCASRASSWSSWYRPSWSRPREPAAPPPWSRPREPAAPPPPDRALVPDPVGAVRSGLPDVVVSMLRRHPGRLALAGGAVAGLVGARVAPGRDWDLFQVGGGDAAEADALVEDVEGVEGAGAARRVRTRNALTLVFDNKQVYDKQVYDKHIVQLVLAPHASLQALLLGFDLAPSRVAAVWGRDGLRLWAAPSWVEALRRMAFWVDVGRCWSDSAAPRVLKYMSKGFCAAVPGTRRAAFLARRRRGPTYTGGLADLFDAEAAVLKGGGVGPLTLAEARRAVRGLPESGYDGRRGAQLGGAVRRWVAGCVCGAAGEPRSRGGAAGDCGAGGEPHKSRGGRGPRLSSLYDMDALMRAYLHGL